MPERDFNLLCGESSDNGTFTVTDPVNAESTDFGSLFLANEGKGPESQHRQDLISLGSPYSHLSG